MNFAAEGAKNSNHIRLGKFNLQLFQLLKVYNEMSVNFSYQMLCWGDWVVQKTLVGGGTCALILVLTFTSHLGDIITSTYVK